MECYFITDFYDNFDKFYAIEIDIDSFDNFDIEEWLHGSGKGIVASGYGLELYFQNALGILMIWHKVNFIFLISNEIFKIVLGNKKPHLIY